jgi:rubrerythrin
MTELPNNLIEIFERAIERENDSFNFYVRAARQTTDPAAKNLLLQLADMERGHWLQLEGLLTELRVQTSITDSIISSFNLGEDK